MRFFRLTLVLLSTAVFPGPGPGGASESPTSPNAPLARPDASTRGAFEGFVAQRFSRGDLPRLADLDGDGRTELLFRSGRRIEVYEPSETAPPQRRFRDTPDRVLDLPEDAVLLDVGELDGDPSTLELAWFGPTGVGWMRAVPPTERPESPESPAPAATANPDGAGARETRGRISNSSTDAPLGLGAVPTWHDFVRDIDGNGSDDLLLPTRTGYSLLRRSHDGVEIGRDDLRIAVLGRVRARLWNLAGTVASSIAWPRVVVGDLDGDGRTDLATVSPDLIERRFQREDGSFPSLPDQRLVLDIRDANLMPDQKRGSVPSRNPLDFPDLDGDGVLDLVINEMRTGTVKVFRGRRDLRLTEPTAVIRIRDWNLGARFADFDGDGWLDLAIPGTREVGLAEGLRLVISRSLELSHQIHSATKDGLGFEPQPRRELRHSIPLGVDASASENSEAGFSIRPSLLVSYTGDYDGDGRGDLLVLESNDEISLYRSRGEGFWSNEATDRVAIPSVTGWRDVTEFVEDFDGDGRSDIFLRYRGGPEPDFGLLLRPTPTR